MHSKGYPESQATETWERDGVTYSIVYHEGMGQPCGYCRFAKRSVREEGYDGILAYVPVHGGITYAERDDDGSIVYGFDCAHYNSPPAPDTAWLHEQCELMARAILAAKPYEKRYLRCVSQKGKAKVLDEYLESIGANADEALGFGAMINLLCGEL